MANNNASNTQRVADNSTPPKSPPAYQTSKKPTPITHLVSGGDSLSYLSSLYNIKISELKRLNKLNTNALRIGQQLKLTAHLAEVKKKSIVHKVNNGETLSGIALRYKTSIVDILALNELSTSSLRVGQTLKIPNASADG